MKILGRVAVFPAIPERIARLHELAFNLWWSWNPSAQDLYAFLDRDLWDAVSHNPVRFLSQVNPQKLQEAAGDKSYLKNFDRIIDEFDHYMHPDTPSWFKQTYPDLLDKPISYFSLEFGLHEALPIYSGGLGILSGDHTKAASDLGLPFIGVGFLYPQGYFTQHIGRDGNQEAIYEKLHFSEVPAAPATNSDGKEVLISVDLPGRRVYAKVWKIQVGRVPLYLMDTDVDPNQPGDRDLSARLYGGNEEIRISQEIMLGVGGVRALRALGIEPAAWHMNEGHSAFLGLERIRELVQGAGLNFAQATEVVMASGIFTTHTPVAAGNDAFGFDLMDRYFGNYWPQLNISRDEFLNFARQETQWGARFSMTVLALKTSGEHNGVSKLHGEVARKMWQFLWPGVDEEEVPVDSITNGIHTQTWLAPELDQLFTRYLGAGWKENLDDPAAWEGIKKIPDGELWQVHNVLKQKLADFTRNRVRQQRIEVGEGTLEVQEADALLDPSAFTIGFARRFATYKRATLIFRHAARLQKILNDPAHPVQIVFAGKAHPADEPGKSFIKQVYQYSRETGFEGRVVIMEDYDMNMARYLVAGVDVWLNNPVRPLEASGTSGQKASLNGNPNFSILDGWWPEAFNGANGWSIGEERAYQDQETQDEADSQSLYSTLENEIVPLYFERGLDEIPHKWVAVMKEAIRTIAPQFSTRRMVKDYTNQLYVPAIRHGLVLGEDGFAAGKELAAWKNFVLNHWHEVSISARAPQEAQMQLGAKVSVEAEVRLGQINPDDVSVELISARDNDGKYEQQKVSPMQRHNGPDGSGLYRFTGETEADSGGSLVFGVRLLPSHSSLLSKHEMGLVRWA